MKGDHACFTSLVSATDSVNLCIDIGWGMRVDFTAQWNQRLLMVDGLRSTVHGVPTPQPDQCHDNIKSLLAHACRNGYSGAWSSERVSGWWRPQRKGCHCRYRYLRDERSIIASLAMRVTVALPFPLCSLNHWRWKTPLGKKKGSLRSYTCKGGTSVWL